MIATVVITEIIGRSEQGVTRPFLCRGDDGELYYVKGQYAGLRSLCCEWVASRIAQGMGLPLPSFAMAEVTGKLVGGSDRADIKDLGAGLAFASARLDGAQEITWEMVSGIPASQKNQVLLFDWWVQNEDRSLSPRGGNPNLLITATSTTPENPDLSAGESPPELCLWAYDFNLAFDSEFDAGRFWSNHIFASSHVRWEAGFKSQMEGNMKAILDSLPELWAELPLDWLHIDGDENLPMQLDFDVVLKTLGRAFDSPGDFWTPA